MDIPAYSPALLGLNLLLACAITSTGLWLFSRPYRGPGWWMTGSWTIALGAAATLAHQWLWGLPPLQILGSALILAGEAIVLLGVFRFYQRPLPYWVIPTSTLAMLLASSLYWLLGFDTRLLDALHALIAGSLQLGAFGVLYSARREPGARGVIRFAMLAMLASALLHWLRAALALQVCPRFIVADLPAHASAPYLGEIDLLLGLPLWLMVMTALALLTMRRILTDGQHHAERAEANAQRFERLLRVSSAAKLVIERGRVSDANPTAERLFGRSREALLGQSFEKLFDSTAQARAKTLLEQADGQPYDLAAHGLDGRRFPAEVRVSGLDDSQQLIAEARDISHRRNLEDKLLRLATTDALTGALNRRAFVVCAEHELRRAMRHAYPLSLAVLDLDHFKRVNDRYGHAVGDQVLRQFSLLCRQLARSTDLFARVGGEEFVFLMPDTAPGAARQFLERLRVSLQDYDFSQQAEGLQMTVSIGVALCQPDSDLNSLQQAADEALYRAKQSGRNRVVQFED